MRNIAEVKAFVCNKCGKAFIDIQAAEQCCAPKSCEDCGIELPLKHYFTVCESCREKRKFERAEKIDFVDYINKDPCLPVFTKEGNMIHHNDLWGFDSEKDWEDCFDDESERPEYVYGAKRQFVRLNADGIISNLNEEVMFEDDVEMFSEEACAEIEKFCDDWNGRNKFEYFDEDVKTVVLIPKIK